MAVNQFGFNPLLPSLGHMAAIPSNRDLQHARDDFTHGIDAHLAQHLNYMHSFTSQEWPDTGHWSASTGNSVVSRGGQEWQRPPQHETMTPPSAYPTHSPPLGVYQFQEHALTVQENNRIQNMNKAFEKQIEEYENFEKKKKDQIDQLKTYAVLMIPFFVLPRNVAGFYAFTELVGIFLDKLGVSDEGSLLFIFMVHTVDAAALSRGRFKLVRDYEWNLMLDIWDYGIKKAGANDFMRIGTGILLGQSSKPEYEKLTDPQSENIKPIKATLS